MDRKMFIPLGRLLQYVVDATAAHYIPPENNPVVFSQLSQSLGVAPSLGFHDIWSFDDPGLLKDLPRPVYALLFTCPAEVFRPARSLELETMPTYDGCGPEDAVMWFRQTIGNSCGLMALLHGLSNGDAKHYIDPDSDLAKLFSKALPLKPTERGEVLYHSQELEVAHMSAAVKGDTKAPGTEHHAGNHYICFVKGDGGHLWELNGGMKGPLLRGTLL